MEEMVMPAPATAVGALAARHRQRLGLSIRRAAALAGISRAHWGDVEAGRRAPSRAMVNAIAGGLALSTGQHDQLLAAAGYLPTPPTWRALLALARDYTAAR